MSHFIELLLGKYYLLQFYDEMFQISDFQLWQIVSRTIYEFKN